MKNKNGQHITQKIFKFTLKHAYKVINKKKSFPVYNIKDGRKKYASNDY